MQSCYSGKNADTLFKPEEQRLITVHYQSMGVLLSLILPDRCLSLRERKRESESFHKALCLVFFQRWSDILAFLNKHGKINQAGAQSPALPCP